MQIEKLLNNKLIILLVYKIWFILLHSPHFCVVACDLYTS